MHAAYEVVLLGVAVFGNVVSEATSLRLGGLVDLVISNTTAYLPFVSPAAPFTIFSTSQPKQKSLSPLLVLVCVCSRWTSTGSMKKRLSVISMLTGYLNQTTEKSIRSHSGSSCTSGLMWAKRRKHPSTCPTSSSLCSILTRATTLRVGSASMPRGITPMRTPIIASKQLEQR